MYEKLQILYSKTGVIVPENAAIVLDKFYYDLTALDQTAAAILTFDAILIAVTVFSAQNTPDNSFHRQLARLVVLVALVSAGLALYVAKISYPFMDKVIITPGPGLDFTEEFKTLDREIELRTTIYRTAWFLSVTVVVLLLFYTLATFFKHFRAPPRPQIR